MTLVFKYRNTTGAGAYDLDIGNQRVRLGEMPGLVQRAELGEAGASTITIDDLSADLTLLGLQWFTVIESALPNPNDQILYNGSIADRRIHRAPDRSAITGAARVWEVDLLDDNTLLGRKILRDVTCVRPTEKANVRLAWLIALSYAPMVDDGLVVYPTHDMDAVDYHGQTFRDVLADIAAGCAYNYFVYHKSTLASNRPGLFFDDPHSTNYSSSLRISNDINDVDSSVTWAPLHDVVLSRSASRVSSGVLVAKGGGGYVYRTSATTRDVFSDVDHVAPMGNVTTNSAATAVADAFLAQSDEEDDRINGVVIRVPVANVLDVRHGQRIQAKFVHLPGYESFRWCRVASCAVAQDEPTSATFRLTLDLSPQGDSCARIANNWTDGISDPISGTQTLDVGHTTSDITAISHAIAGSPGASGGSRSTNSRLTLPMPGAYGILSGDVTIPGNGGIVSGLNILAGDPGNIVTIETSWNGLTGVIVGAGSTPTYPVAGLYHWAIKFDSLGNVYSKIYPTGYADPGWTFTGGARASGAGNTVAFNFLSTNSSSGLPAGITFVATVPVWCYTADA